MTTIRLIALAAGILAGTVHGLAQTWMQLPAPSQTWSALAASADGNKVIAGGLSWNCYTTTNSGAFWTQLGEPQSNSITFSWYYLASSADGNALLAATASSAIFVSTNAGVTWLSNNVPSVAMWGPVAMSADGTKMVAAAGGGSHPPGYIYISTNWGTTWNATTAPTNVWMGIASSADGNKLAAVAGGGNSTGWIYMSTNAGATWAQAGTTDYWMSVACSRDGTKLAAVSFKENDGTLGRIYTSTDSGNNWTISPLAAGSFNTVSMSADGNTLVAGAQPGNNTDILVSTNFGAAWTTNLLSSDFFNGNVMSVAASADGDKLFAATMGGQIYIRQNTPRPQLSLNCATNIRLGWTIPSTNFLLQQSVDLANWTTVTNDPALNFTNLQNQVTLPAPDANAFFRLKTP